jgi:ribosomal protein S27E
VIRNFLRNFMIGRYGPDHLNMALIVAALIISVLARFTLPHLTYLAYVILIYSLFRSFSRNIPKRRAENDKFLRFYWPVKTKIKNRFHRLKSRRHFKYFKCPSCKNLLRVPKKKGKIQVTCPKCGERFNKKT